jgi:hypothetical protein
MTRSSGPSRGRRSTRLSRWPCDRAPAPAHPVRFPNEAEALSSYADVGDGAILIRVERPGVGPVNRHISETALDDWPFPVVIVNDGSPEQMLDRLAATFQMPALSATPQED